MFSRTLATISFTAVALVATVSANYSTVTVTVYPTPSPTPIPVSQCNTGSIQCCESTQTASSTGLTSILALLGIVIDPVTALIGLTCSPVDVIGISGTSCSQQPVCCEDNHFSGLIAVGCTPVNLNL